MGVGGSGLRFWLHDVWGAWSLRHIQLFVSPRTVACQAPLSIEFFRQECWSGLPFFPPGNLSDSGVEPASPVSSCIGRQSLYLYEPPGKHEQLTWLISTEHAPRGWADTGHHRMVTEGRNQAAPWSKRPLSALDAPMGHNWCHEKCNGWSIRGKGFNPDVTHRLGDLDKGSQSVWTPSG